MNLIERYVYDILKNNAKLKDGTVAIYQGIFSIFGKMKGAIRSNYDIQVFDDFFFGFHDKFSLNKEGKLLGHRASSTFIAGIGKAKIGYYEIDQPDVFHELAETSCCNNQQGSMLCWLSSNKIAYNDYIDNNVVTVILDINSKETEILPFHFASASPCSYLFSSINYCRFGKGIRGYGYDIAYNDEINSDAKNEISTSQCGDLVVYDIKNNEERYRLTSKEARELSISSFPKLNGYEYFSHTCFSPDSQLMYFLYRSFNGKKNSSQLFVINFLTGELKEMPTGGMVSHLHWLKPRQIVAYCNLKDNKDGYYIFDLNTDKVTPFIHAQLTADGHPNAYTNNERVFVTDTYPDRERRQPLYLVNEEKNTVEKILDVYSPRKFRGVERVDFHPRFSQCGKYVTVDSPHLNSRSQLVIKL